MYEYRLLRYARNDGVIIATITAIKYYEWRTPVTHLKNTEKSTKYVTLGLSLRVRFKGSRGDSEIALFMIRSNPWRTSWLENLEKLDRDRYCGHVLLLDRSKSLNSLIG